MEIDANIDLMDKNDFFSWADYLSDNDEFLMFFGAITLPKVTKDGSQVPRKLIVEKWGLQGFLKRSNQLQEHKINISYNCAHQTNYENAF